MSPDVVIWHMDFEIVVVLDVLASAWFRGLEHRLILRIGLIGLKLPVLCMPLCPVWSILVLQVWLWLVWWIWRAAWPLDRVELVIELIQSTVVDCVIWLRLDTFKCAYFFLDLSLFCHVYVGTHRSPCPLQLLRSLVWTDWFTCALMSQRLNSLYQRLSVFFILIFDCLQVVECFILMFLFNLRLLLFFVLLVPDRSRLITDKWLIRWSW